MIGGLERDIACSGLAAARLLDLAAGLDAHRIGPTPGHRQQERGERGGAGPDGLHCPSSYYGVQAQTNFGRYAVPVLAAMVLAAGYGTRLRPLTDRCAKALFPVGDRPALAHVVDRLRAAGVPRVVVNAHHRADDIGAFVATSRMGIAVSEEKELLGTAGGVARAAAALGNGDVIVWNADVLTDVDLRALVAAQALGEAEATLVVQMRPPGSGPVGVDGQGRIVRLRGERLADEVQGGEFLGISIVGAGLRATLPEQGGLVEDVWLPALRAGATLRAFEHASLWHDIGTPGGYLAANLAWLRVRQLEHWTGDGARVASAVRLDESVLGPRAVVVGSGPLARCVVWAGERATAPLKEAIVGPELIVSVPPLL
jgi:mannose-1-phosphate guanylyltransferase